MLAEKCFHVWFLDDRSIIYELDIVRTEGSEWTLRGQTVMCPHSSLSSRWYNTAPHHLMTFICEITTLQFTQWEENRGQMIWWSKKFNLCYSMFLLHLLMLIDKNVGLFSKVQERCCGGLTLGGTMMAEAKSNPEKLIK